MGAIPELPEGPVTVMFTDIEGSTALRTSAGDAEADSLFGKHDEIIRAEIENHRGYDFQAALGDGFLAVFVSTRRAIACAVAIQQALDKFNQQRRGAPLRVRIGLNTGEIAWTNNQPSGEAIHAASRVCGAADGGEVFVSDVTRQLAGTIPDVTFTDRGEHTLKGFPQPWKLWALAWRKAQTAAHQDVFVEREREFAELRGHLTSALDGHGGIVLVGGEPGVGKTTLTKELIKEAQSRGALALFGRCYESEGAVPYSPFVEIVEQAMSVVPPEWILEDLGDDVAEIARMVPVLRRHFPDIGEPLDLPPEQQRRYFFNAMTSFITRAAARLPVVLVLDDVHWADEPTLLLIEHVATALKQLRILGVGTYRDVELDVSRPLAATLERMLRARTAARIPLSRFDRAGVANMIEGLASRSAPPKLIDAIYSETEGNPFFVEEVFRHFVEEGKVFDESGEFLSDIAINELDVPESVRLVVGRRLERLGPEAHKALAAGAVVGRGFSFSLLEAIAGIDGGAVLDIVDEAERARVIVPEERDGDVYYTFAHELIRQTLLSSLSIPRRQRLHLAVADAIERTDPNAAEIRPSEIATHLLEAGVAADADRTIGYLVRAAERAYAAAAFEDAGRFAESGLEMLGSADRARRTQLLEILAHTQRAATHYEDAIATYRSVIAAYAELGDVESAGRLSFDLGYLLVLMVRFPEALQQNNEGIALLGDRVTPARANLLGGTAAILSLAGFVEMSEPHIVQAEALAEELGPAVQGRVAWLRAVQRSAAGEFEPALAAGRRAAEFSRSCGDLWTLTDALSWNSIVATSLGAWDELRDAAEEAVDLGAKTGHTTPAAIAKFGLITRELRLGGDLERYEERVRENSAFIEASPFAAQAYAAMASAAQLRGKVEDALAHIDHALEIELPSATAMAWGVRLLNRALAGTREECDILLADRLGDLTNRNNEMTIGRYNILSSAGEAAAIVHNERVAAELRPLIAEHTSAPVAYRYTDGADPNRVAGMLAATVGEWDDAERHFEQALASDVENVIEAPQIRHWYGKMLLDRGRPEDREPAQELISTALAEYERIGMPVHAGMARELLRVNA